MRIGSAWGSDDVPPVSRWPSARPGKILPSAPLLASLCTFTPHDDMHGEGALTATHQIVSKPVVFWTEGFETSEQMGA